MEKSKILKIILVMLVGLALIFMSTEVFAENELIDITDIVDGSGSNSTNTNLGANTNTNSNVANTNANATNTNLSSNLSANNTSSYNNTNLPSTGIAQTGSLICIIFALVISALYAFKKIRDYNNI